MAREPYWETCDHIVGFPGGCREALYGHSVYGMTQAAADHIAATEDHAFRFKNGQIDTLTWKKISAAIRTYIPDLPETDRDIPR